MPGTLWGTMYTMEGKGILIPVFKSIMIYTSLLSCIFSLAMQHYPGTVLTVPLVQIEGQLILTQVNDLAGCNE